MKEMADGSDIYDNYSSTTSAFIVIHVPSS